VLRSLVGTTAALALSVTVAGPVAADPRDPLAGVPMHPEWGSVAGKPGVLRRGCHTYTYNYTVTPPEGIWALEVFITGPGFKNVAGGAFVDGYDPVSGTGTYKLCRPTVRYGQFSIVAKVSVDNGSGEIVEGRTDTDHFRLHRPHRHR
jgi:hypothetical protein